MAHVVRNLQYPAGLFKFPPMPPVCLTLLPRYKALYPDRVTDFLPSEKPEESIIKVGVQNLPPEEFKHLLRYDAESVFWIILFWSILSTVRFRFPYIRNTLRCRNSWKICAST